MRITKLTLSLSLLLQSTLALALPSTPAFDTLCNPDFRNSSAILSVSLAKQYVPQFCAIVRPRSDPPEASPLPTIYNTDMNGSENIELGFTQYNTSIACIACLASFDTLFGDCGSNNQLKGVGTIDSNCGFFTFQILTPNSTNISNSAHPTQANGGMSGRQRIFGSSVLLAWMAGVFWLL